MSENTGSGAGKGIKTREVKHDIKALDKAAEMAKSMKQAAVRTKDQVQNLTDDGQITPEEYAEDRMRYAAEDTASEAGRQTKKAARKAKNKVEDNVRRHHEKKQQEKLEKKVQEARKNTRQAGKAEETARNINVKQREFGVKQHEARVRAVHQKKQTVKTADTSRRAIRQTAKSTGRAAPKTVNSTVKATKRTVKTAEQTSRAAIKTTKAAAKTAEKAVKASEKAAKAAAAAAKKAAIAAYKAAVVVAKAIASAVKGIIAAVKGLIAMIAAGGWMAVVAILIICLVGLLVGSIFGIFFSSEDTGSDKTMRTVVQEINTDYQSEIDDIKSSNTYDEVEMTGSTAVWREVLAVYAVKTNNDPENPQEVASIDDNKISILEDIFWEMNDISSRTETKTVTKVIETDDGRGNVVEETVEETQTILYINVTHKTADEMAAQYGFNDEEKQQMAELLDEKNRSLWAQVLYGIRAGDSDIVEVALSQVGQVGGQPYWSWYGFDNRVAWCACFVSWCANECGYIEDGIIPKYAGCVNGVQWFKDREQWVEGNEEPVPGMIIFFDWDDPGGDNGPQDGLSDHTGIVIRVEDGIVYTVEGNSSDSCRQKQYSVGYYEILGYGAPAY